MKRDAIFESLRAKPEVSVLIVGGGINGVGLLRELALQGIDTLLIDKSDYCAGASAASTRIIHGGLRYLENGEFRLVKESLTERNRLLLNAPHYVRPLPTTIPIFDWTSGIFHAAKMFFRLTSKPGNRGALIIKAGLTLYDIFSSYKRTMPTHHFTSRAKSLALRPQLNPKIVCTATYYDARISYPERLCLELIRDAEAVAARAVNYVTVQGASGDTVTLKDELSGETVDVRPMIVVNATGAWIDFTNQALKRQTQYIGGTKGSHLVLDNAELYEATRGEMLYFANVEGRICIFYPFYDKIIAGSTDIAVDDPDALCDEGEVDYILESIRQVFPAIQVDRSHIVFRYCGVRPLPRSSAATAGQISRDHSFPKIPAGDGVSFPIYSLIGGKWTTFRAFAEQVADALLADLGRARKTRSEDLAIGGGRGYPKTEADKQQWFAAMREKSGLTQARLETLLDRYGTRAEAVAGFIAEGEDRPLQYQPGYSVREIEFLAANEQVIHLDDLILRRTLIGFLGQTTTPLLEELAGIVSRALGWPEQRTRAEIERTAKLLEVRHGIDLKAQHAAPLAAG